MLVYLVRHGIAQDRDTSNHDDERRCLTDVGLRKMREIIAGLSSIDVRFDAVLASPLVRARQTAECLMSLCNHNQAIEMLDALAPGGFARAILDRLSEFDEADAIALVGHEPDLSSLCSLLLGSPRHETIRLKKGGVACLELAGADVHPGSATLIWLMQPRMMKRL